MKLGFTIFLLLCSSCLFAQIGTRFKSLANHSAALKSVWNISDNPAGSPITDRIIFASLKEYNFIASDIKNEALAFSVPFNKLRTSFSAFNYGNIHFKQHVLATSMALNFKLFSLGLGIQVQQTKVPLLETENTYSLSLGTQIPINEVWLIGLSVSNLDIRAEEPHSASRLSLGLSYAPTKQALVTSTIGKLPYSNLISGGLGIEYNLVEPLTLRLGFQTKPSLKSLGFEYSLRRWKFLSALSSQSSLGNKIQIELNYEL